MEPAAPGTEDDPISNQDFRQSKKDTPEALALSKKAILPNGKYDNIFLLEYVDGAQHWYCKVCDRPVLGRIFNHEVGKKHMAWLKLGNNCVEGEGEDEDENNGSLLGTGMVVAPGEPLPPGFEGEMEVSKTHIQDRLDKFNVGPLVGLEYLLELLDYDPSKEPSYMCILCHKKGDPRTILTHLASYNHQVAYLQRHFPTAYRRIAPYMIKVYKRNWQAGLQKICDAIETTFGRLKPIQVDAGKFNKDNVYYMEMVAKGKHFNELSGQSFENVVTIEELTKVHEEPKKNAPASNQSKKRSPSPPVVAKPVKRAKTQAETFPRKRSLSPVSDVSSSDLEDYDPRSPVKLNQKGNERKPRGGSVSQAKTEGSLPWQKSSYRKDRPAYAAEKSRDDKAEKFEEFKRLAKAIDNQMAIVLKRHKENPEKHPKYNDEWKKFWNTRYKELQAEGKNAATHDFKPEWIEFWNKRILELHQEEVKTSKAALRKRLGLPDEPAPISFKIGERRKPATTSKKPVPTAAQPDNDPEVIVIEDIEDDAYKTRRNRSKSPVKKRDRSPKYRRRAFVKDSPPIRRNKSPSPISPYSRNQSPPTRRRSFPPSHRRVSPPPRPSPPTMRLKESPKRQLSPLSRRKCSPTLQRAPSPPLRIKTEKFSPSPLRDSSPRRDKYDRMRDKSEEKLFSRGKSREISWERERERRRDYDEKHWDRSYRGRDPWDHDPHHYPFDPYAPPKVLRDVSRKPMLEPEDVDEDDGNVNIVAVLRLLTALEEKLGSLGPKVIDLLAQALAMEKKVANSSEELLDNELNCVLFETVKEKLKGQLQAGLVDWIQEKAFKNAIKKTASLIHVAGERKKQKEQEMPKKPVVVPGIGKVDKGKIARQIANALIAQGKTDVTQNELEQLINAVVGIAEAQKNSSEPLTTASFLEKIENSQITPKVDQEPEPKTTEKEKEKEAPPPKMDEDQASSSSMDKTTINMEGLSDSDLETLLQNFKDLSSDEQLGLINYLKKLEAKEPDRVEKLRKFVNLPDNADEKDGGGRYSPFMSKMEEITTKTNEEKKDEENKEDNSGFINIDSEDEYSFEDVAKAVSQKVNEREQKKLEDKNLDDAKAFITSLMSSLNKNVAGAAPATQGVSSAEKSTTEKIKIISSVPVSSADIAKSLSGITMSVSSLGNILGNVKNLTNNKVQTENQQEQRTNNLTQSATAENAAGSAAPPRNYYNSFEQPRNKPYNEFDIASQRDLKNVNDYNPQNFRGRSNKLYDEFNIGPMSRDPKEDFREVRMSGPSNSRLSDNSPGFSDMAPSYLERSNQLESNPPYSQMQVPAAHRGNAMQERAGQPFANQFQQRPGPFPNKTRPVGNSFDQNFGRDEYDPRTTDDFRGGMSDFRGGGPANFRNNAEYREDDYRGARGLGNQGNHNAPVDEMRHRGEFRGNFPYPRGGQAHKLGNFNNANRQGNFPSSSRYPGNNNYNNSYNRW